MGSAPRARAKVSVGLPTYNAEETIQGTLTTLLAQEYEDLEVLVSDNASVDGTVEICRDLVGGDPRFRLVVHERNGGWQFNFRFLLAQAQAPLFMWLGSDDLLAPRFIAENRDRLTADPRAVTSVSKVRWLHDGVPGALASGTDPLAGSPRANVAQYLRHARDNSRFYGLHRTDVLRASFPKEDFFGLDIAIMLGTLRYGTHAEVPEVLLQRERHAPGSYGRQIEADARGLPDRILPMGRFSKAILTELRVPMSAPAMLWLVVRNAFEHARYWAYRGGLYGRLVQPAFALMENRRAAVTGADDDARGGDL